MQEGRDEKEGGGQMRAWGGAGGEGGFVSFIMKVYNSYNTPGTQLGVTHSIISFRTNLGADERDKHLTEKIRTSGPSRHLN